MTGSSLINNTQGKPITDCQEGQKLNLEPATPGVLVETICASTGKNVTLHIMVAAEGQKIICDGCLPLTARR